MPYLSENDGTGLGRPGGHGAVTGASHPRGRLTGLAQHAGETAVDPLVVQRPQVRAGLLEGM